MKQDEFKERVTITPFEKQSNTPSQSGRRKAVLCRGRSAIPTGHRFTAHR
ncbi:hypothetical protein RBSWK_01841 [Rhodopirellula baltica SWK14]|uniref:Uncharacterized protein n=1 Tax=Rhodopirellula baltica SWK14 TaxID=993516 RepID=L7CJ38_RHOBT|nr:hypothetical protein RBSWK_01841 [Rhodopirellula baltica SWK14]